MPTNSCISSAEMIQAGRAVFTAMTHLQNTHSVVTRYRTKVLLDGQWHVHQMYVQLGMQDEVLLVPDKAYLMGEEMYQIYEDLCIGERIKSGLRVLGPEVCPLVEAKRLLSEAQCHLIHQMSDTSDLLLDRLLILSTHRYEDFIEMSLLLLEPFMDRSGRILFEDSLLAA